MSKEPEDFWAGGSWEQPTSRYLPPSLPNSNLTGHIRRSQAIRSGRHRLVRGLKFALGVVATVAVVAGIGIAVGNQFLPTVSYPIPSGGSGGGSGWSGGGGMESYYQESTSDELTFPQIPQAELLSEDLIVLSPSDGASLTPQEIYAQNQASVVYIETLTEYGLGAGTGVIISEDGYIITNAHVVSGGIETVVTLWDESFYSASILCWDGDEDLAVLKIDAENLSPATFGDSSTLQVGDTAYAIGNPLGSEYRSTFTDGIISALDRYLDIDGIYMSLIQTTAPINMGNSGGALLNDQGEVIGITTIKIMSSSDTIENMGFAIPSSRVAQVINSLSQGVELVTPALGVTVSEVIDPVRGLAIQEVSADSYADEAGLLPGDILIYAAGVPLNYTNDLYQVKDSMMVGDTLTVTVYRDGEIFDVDVVLSVFDDVYPDE